VNCDDFVDRLYDDDARSAQRGTGTVPADMSAHLLVCDACRTAYELACEDERLLPTLLVESPPPAWQAAVLRQMAPVPRVDWTRRIATVNEAMTWGILALAASHALLGGSSMAAHAAAFWTGGAAALMRPHLVKHWLVFVRRPLRWV
jgi:hypothetical protein